MKIFFIGSGSLLTSAIFDCINISLQIGLVCVPPGDSSLPTLRKFCLNVIESTNPSNDLLLHVSPIRGFVVFSINNKYILTDQFLSLEAKYYNIHNGLVQKYRGMAEICIIAALVNNESKYGVTLHELLPGQKVDSGPIISQESYEINNQDTFQSMMSKSIMLCKSVFKNNLKKIVSDHLHSIENYSLGLHYSYDDLDRILRGQPREVLDRLKLGAYENYFPRLHSVIRKYQ